MVERKKLMIYIGSAFVLVLVIVGITLAIVLTGKDNNHVEDDVVRAFHDLLAQHTSFQPREVSLFLYPELIEPVPQEESHLQIIYGGEVGSDPEPSNPSEAKDPRKKLVIDHDGGADDAFAIIMALLYEKYFGGPKVVALTTVFGNVDSTQALFNSGRILTLCGRQDIPIYPGASGPLISGITNDFYFGEDGLGDTGYQSSSVNTDGTLAAVALLNLAKKYGGELIIVATGPLTNIALAVRLDNFFMSGVYRLYIGAGHIHSNEHPLPEFNAAMDPEAYYIATIPNNLTNVTYVPFSQVHKSLNISLDWRLNSLGKVGTPIMEALNRFERKSLEKSSSWAQLDPATMAIALNEDFVVEFRNSTNSIGLEGVHRGITTVNFAQERFTIRSRTFLEANITKYKDFLMDVFTAGELP